jgi:hypothetical protein
MPCGHPRLGGIALIFANSRDVLESAKTWDGSKMIPAMP